jgi:hypothetical protein
VPAVRRVGANRLEDAPAVGLVIVDGHVGGKYSTRSFGYQAQVMPETVRLVDKIAIFQGGVYAAVEPGVEHIRHALVLALIAGTDGAQHVAGVHLHLRQGSISKNHTPQAPAIIQFFKAVFGQQAQARRIVLESEGFQLSLAGF